MRGGVPGEVCRAFISKTNADMLLLVCHLFQRKDLPFFGGLPRFYFVAILFGMVKGTVPAKCVQIPNLSDTVLIWYRTYLIANVTDTDLSGSKFI
jgi:hypothetical protein